jgi:hypothetical protein
MQRKQTVELSQKEMKTMLSKPAQERYIYSVKRIAEREIAWTLKNENGMVSTEDDEGNVFLPIWPFKEYALKCRVEEWGDCELMKLSLDYLLEEMLPNLSKTSTKISVFIVPNDPMSTTVSAKDLLNNLLHECSKYE